MLQRLRKKATGSVVLSLVMLTALSCNNSSSAWTESDKKEFIGGCMKGAAKDLPAEKAATYCQCMWQKIQERYPQAVSPSFIKNDTALYRFGRECFAEQQ